MSQYLLSVHIDYDAIEGEDAPTAEQMEQVNKDVDVLNQELRRTGAWVFGGGLHPPSTATVVKAQDGDILTTDGPFAETKEHIGGFWVIEAPDLDGAMEWAAKATVACQGPIEVRPLDESEA